MRRITVDLTEEEVGKLKEMLWFQDEGPEPEGWQSELAKSVHKKVELAIDLASKVDP